MMITLENIMINIFVEVDDFYKTIIPSMDEYIAEYNHNNNGKRVYRIRKDTLSESEIITILILYQLSSCKNLKKFYMEYNGILKTYFPKLPCYNRFLMLERKITHLLPSFISHLFGEETGIYYIDSTPLAVCRNQRIHKHKTFRDLAERGKSSIGWFYGFKLHLIINNEGELMNFKLTKGNVFDNRVIEDLVKYNRKESKLFGDKGYICKEEVKNKLRDKYNMELITKSRRNMKHRQYDTLSEENKRFLRKRNLVETVIGEIKRLTNITATKIKNVFNYFVNIFSSILTYQLKIRMKLG